MRIPFLSILLCTVFAGNAMAQVTLLKDINQLSDYSEFSSSRAFEGKSLYVTSSYELGKNILWITDGATTTKLGFCDDYYFEKFPIRDKKFYFTYEGNIWRTDGTVAGTELLVTGNFSIDNATWAGNKLIIAAYDDVTGQEMWVTDFTQAGTKRLREEAEWLNNYPLALFSVGNFGYFTTDINQSADKLWKSDGTIAGTTFLGDIYRSNAAAKGNDIYYISDFDELRKYDGNNFTTIKSITNYPGSPVFNQSLIPVKDNLFFTVLNESWELELWKADVTNNATRVKVLGGDDFSLASWYRVIGDVLYFMYDDGIHGNELWRTDGTSGGTFLLKDIYEGEYSASTFSGVVLNDKFYFASYDGSDTHVFVSDGTTAGTQKLKTTAGYERINLTTYKDAVYFVVPDGDQTNSLWQTKGTVQSTVAIKNLGEDDFVTFLQTSNQLLIGTNYNYNLRVFWKSDGTAAGTMEAFPFGNGGSSDPSRFVTLGNKLFFTADNGTYAPQVWSIDDGGVKEISKDIPDIQSETLWSASDQIFFRDYRDLWAIKSTGEQTQLTNIGEASTFEDVKNSISAVGNTVFFAGYDATHGYELWVSDGSVAGTTLLKDVVPGESSSVPTSLINHKERLFFLSNFNELWTSDGTESGTQFLKTISQDSCGLKLVGNADDQFFFTRSNWNGISLWKSDGTSEGTLELSTIAETNQYNVLATVFNEKLFYTAPHGNGEALFATDGTIGSEQIVESFNATDNGEAISQLAATSQQVYFAARTDATGFELWKTTGDGVSLVEDIAPNEASSNPANVTVVGDSVVFTTTEGDNTTFWITKGTTTYPHAGPIPVSVRSGFFPVGDKLVFTANTFELGTELYALHTTIMATTPDEKRTLLPYPNPFRDSDLLTITVPATHGTVNFFTTTGTRLTSIDFNSSTVTLRGSSLPMGITILKIQTKSGVFTSKIIKR